VIIPLLPSLPPSSSSSSSSSCLLARFNPLAEGYLGKEASAWPQFAKERSFYEEEKRAGGATTAQEGLEIAKLGISSKIIDRLASKGITKLLPIR
jgi:hypothetical protein